MNGRQKGMTLLIILLIPFIVTGSGMSTSSRYEALPPVKTAYFEESPALPPSYFPLPMATVITTPDSFHPADPPKDSVPQPTEVTSPPVFALDTALPDTNPQDPEYIQFSSDIIKIIKKAERESGIKSDYGVFVMDLEKGFHTGVNENLTWRDPEDGATEGFFNSASVIKLFQGYILCDMMRHGELDGDIKYFDKVTGRTFKLPAMIRTMLAKSDNNYSNASLRLIGNEKSNEVLMRLGIENSRIYGEMSGAQGYSRQNNLSKYGTAKRCARITPADTGLILYNIYRYREEDEYMALLYQGLTENIYNTRIPVGVKRVSKKIPVAHKTGTNSSLGIYNDAGIVYAKQPYILCALTRDTSLAAGESFIRSLSQQLTLYFSSNPQ